MTGTGWRRAIAVIAVMSAGWPNRWTGMMPLVRSVILASSEAGSMFQVSGSESTNTGRAPQ